MDAVQQQTVHKSGSLFGCHTQPSSLHLAAGFQSIWSDKSCTMPPAIVRNCGSCAHL